MVRRRGPGSDFQYRANGIPQQAPSDYLRADYINNFATDYQLYWFGGGDWANYTRDYPTGHFNIYVRTSGLGAFTMNLGEVISGGGTTNQVVKPLGRIELRRVHHQRLRLGAVDGCGRGCAGHGQYYRRYHLSNNDSDRRLLSEFFHVGSLFGRQSFGGPVGQ